MHRGFFLNIMDINVKNAKECIDGLVQCTGVTAVLHKAISILPDIDLNFEVEYLKTELRLSNNIYIHVLFFWTMLPW